MSRRGAKVVMLCRNVEAAEVVAEEIRKETEGEVIVHRSSLIIMFACYPLIINFQV